MLLKLSSAPEPGYRLMVGVDFTKEEGSDQQCIALIGHSSETGKFYLLHSVYLTQPLSPSATIQQLLQLLEKDLSSQSG